MPDAGAAVVRFQRAYSSVAKAAILHELLARGPVERVVLTERLGITGPSVRKALDQLIDAGYVTYELLPDTTATSQVQPRGTVYTAHREPVLTDLAATLVWLSQDRRPERDRKRGWG